MLNVFGMRSDRYEALLPWRIPVIAAARKRSTRSSRGGEAVSRLGSAGRLHLRGGQQMGERVEVVADADPALRRGLERGRAPPGEGVEDDVTGPAVARDEGVRQRRWKARQVRAHRVERVAPQALLGFPLRLDREAG